MNGTILNVCIFVILLISGAAAQTYRVCAREGLSQQCQGIERGGSSVVCVNVVDNTDCALKISQDQADFGVFTAEEAVLLSQLQPDVYNVLGSVRHEDRRNETFAFQSVAVVSRTHVGGLTGLRGGHFCHPGFGGREQLWSNRVLKYFEQKVVYAGRQCESSSRSPAETDGHALSRFFGSACRPGPWVADSSLDAELKSKFPLLCSLCGQTNGSCAYSTTNQVAVAGSSSHIQALNCLSNSGTVAYVAWQHVKDYFAVHTSNYTNYALLCPDGTVRPFANLTTITGEPECAWIKQPWSALLASKRVSSDLGTSLKSLIPNGRARDPNSWTFFLDAVLFREPSSFLVHETNNTLNLVDYVKAGRPIPAKTEYRDCHAIQRWCTISTAESLKCSWLQHALLTIGAEPQVSCVQTDSAVSCLRFIAENKADFISIDSNYGYLARRAYDLQNILYHETQNLFRSKVIALLKENSTSTITRFENLRDKNACFPEYGGIAWVSFLRAAHEREVISSRECDTAVAISEFFRDACAPGATDENYSPSKTANITRLCSVCEAAAVNTVAISINEIGVQTQNPAANSSSISNICTADHNNRFFGTNGTLACIASPNTDVAFIENQYLANHAATLRLNPADFRVLCRNNSLALRPGFDVDSNCLLSETVDSEIVTRKNNNDFTSLRALLHEVDEQFGYTVTSTKLIGLEVFSPFNGVADLLFKDSTIGLTNSDTDSQTVRNYVELFKHADDCSSATTPGTGSGAATFSIVTGTLITYLVTIFML